MRFQIAIHDSVFQQLDAWLDHATASQVVADLYRELPVLPFSERQDRMADEPDVFLHGRVVAASGMWQLLLFEINDGWEVDRLHVVGVKRDVGGRAGIPR